MKPTHKYLTQIAGFLFVIIFVADVFADGQFNCPKITDNQCPALLFIEGSVDKSNLYIAHFDGKTVHREEIISSRYIQVTQLDNAVFLVSVSESSNNGKVYAIDFSIPKVKFLAQSTRIRCLRAQPQRKAAMLMDVNGNIGRIQLIELNLANLESTLRYTLSKELLGDNFIGIAQSMKLSPDFKHIVYASRKGGKEHELWSEYTLRILDLATMKTEDLDKNVGVQISGISSFPWGIPVIEWINNDEIIYRDMVPNEPNEISKPALDSLNIFKSVNIKTKEISELFRKELRLTLDGGSLQTNPLNEKLLYSNRSYLNLRDGTLTPKNFPFSVIVDKSTKQTQLLEGADVLYCGNERCVGSCISTSGGNFAYSLRPKRGTLSVKLYAKFEGSEQPLKIAQGPYSPTSPIAWIESTSLSK
ncbi:MAG: hypothetical protein ACYS9Y_01035 [Planctomycetota bacterium]|jgi:hypothetical protein